MEFKSVSEVLDFVVDWTAELGSDTINTSAWAVDSGITLDSDTNTTLIATAWISGGTLGYTYKLTNTIVTANATPRTHIKEFYLRIQNQRAG